VIAFPSGAFRRPTALDADQDVHPRLPPRPSKVDALNISEDAKEWIRWKTASALFKLQ
jgi:hypothetical protein